MKKELNLLAAPIVAALLFLIGCGSSGSKTVAVTGVALDQSYLSLIVGDTATIAATVQPDNASNGAVTWSTSDSAVTSVAANGLSATITAVAAGTATITAASQADAAKAATCTVTVMPAINISVGGAGSRWGEYGVGGYTMVIRPDGSLWAWGCNTFGQLGLGDVTSRRVPERVGIDTWANVAAGPAHTMAIKRDGSLWGWGNNADGQLGDGTKTTRPFPTRIGSDTDWKAVSAGLWSTVAIKTDGSLWTWGGGARGQLGNGTSGDRTVPGPAGSDTNWETVSAGQTHIMAIKTDGSLWGWGDNQYGALGDGTTSNRNVPTLIGSDTWAAVSCGGDYGSTMALRSDGSLWGWGFNGYGTIGDGTNVNKSAPTRVGGDTDWAAVSQGTTVTTGLKTGGALWNWGYSPYGELGDGTVDDEHFYLPSPLGTDTWLGAVSSSHTIAIKADDSLWAWGRNNFGQIGDGTNINRNAPVSISLTATSADLGNAASPMEGAKTLKAMDLPTKLHKQERWPGKPRRRQ